MPRTVAYFQVVKDRAPAPFPVAHIATQTRKIIIFIFHRLRQTHRAVIEKQEVAPQNTKVYGEVLLATAGSPLTSVRPPTIGVLGAPFPSTADASSTDTTQIIHPMDAHYERFPKHLVHLVSSRPALL